MAGNGKVQIQMIGFATLKLTSPEGKAFFPVNYEWQNVNELLDGKWVPFWDVFGNSLVVSFGQALGAVTLSAMAWARVAFV